MAKGKNGGKTKYWRRISEKVNGVSNGGRLLRNAMVEMGQGKPLMLPIHVWLFRAAGIGTPVFDARMKMRHTVNSEAATDGDVVDAEIINEGVPNAVA